MSWYDEDFSGCPVNSAVDSTTVSLEPPPTLHTVSIIGTAGRDKSQPTMTAALFDAMVIEAENLIVEKFKLDPSTVVLVSGGSGVGRSCCCEAVSRPTKTVSTAPTVSPM